MPQQHLDIELGVARTGQRSFTRSIALRVLEGPWVPIGQQTIIP